MTVACDYVQRTDLIQTLSLAGRVVPRRAIREVLTCVSLAPDGWRLPMARYALRCRLSTAATRSCCHSLA